MGGLQAVGKMRQKRKHQRKIGQRRRTPEKPDKNRPGTGKKTTGQGKKNQECFSRPGGRAKKANGDPNNGGAVKSRGRPNKLTIAWNAGPEKKFGGAKKVSETKSWRDS